jgi:hypothetical protein
MKALAKSNGNLFAIDFKSEKEQQLSLSHVIKVGRAITSERQLFKKNQRTDTKKYEKRNKSDT